jgi:hypothetical protein
MGVAVTGVESQPSDGFTQLWLLPDPQGAENVVRLGLQNREAAKTSYRLEVLADGFAIAEWSPIELDPDEQWEVSTSLLDDHSGSALVEAILYRTDAPDTVYRRVQVANQR